MSAQKHNLATSGAGYFFLGFTLIRQKGIKRFVLIPLVVNLILFFFAFQYLYKKLDYYIAELTTLLPDWLTWLSSLLWPLAVVGMLILFSFIFTSVANWLAAPFNGLLSEKVEALLTGETPPDGGVVDIIKDIPRTFIREWKKFAYYIPRAIGFLLLFFILPLVGQIIWFLFVAWMMAIQYKDYPFDNHKISFDDMRSILQAHKGLSYSFGITTCIFSMLPLINFIVMPVAICGATALWVDRYKHLKYNA
jgi:CysZ protein